MTEKYCRALKAELLVTTTQLLLIASIVDKTSVLRLPASSYPAIIYILFFKETSSCEDLAGEGENDSP